MCSVQCGVAVRIRTLWSTGLGARHLNWTLETECFADAVCVNLTQAQPLHDVPCSVLHHEILVLGTVAPAAGIVAVFWTWVACTLLWFTGCWCCYCILPLRLRADADAAADADAPGAPAAVVVVPGAAAAEVALVDLSAHSVDATPPTSGVPDVCQTQVVHVAAVSASREAMMPPCIACTEICASVLFVPCGHVPYCRTCTAKDRNQQCPICKQSVSQKQQLYFTV